MSTVAFTIPGRVHGKGRATPFVQKRRVVITTQPKTRKAEAIIRQRAATAMRGRQVLIGALKVSVRIWVRHPDSWSKHKKSTANWPVMRPDIDNVAKTILDAMNGIVWFDDSQIASLDITRQYLIGDEHVFVEVRTLNQGPPYEYSVQKSPRGPVPEVDGRGGSLSAPDVGGGERSDHDSESACGVEHHAKRREKEGCS